MSDPLDLLPQSATPLEVALSRADAGQLLAPTEVIRTVLDPARAPAALLPWLALQHRVKHTRDPSASVDRKRQIIAAQYGILQHAGTPKGLADALGQLGLGVGYDEWWEYGGAPYHIRLRVEIDGDSPWTATFDRRVFATVFEYKNRRTALGEFVMVRALPAGGPALAAVQYVGDDVAYLLLPPDVDPPPAVPALGAALLIGELVAFALLTPDITPPAAAMAPGAALLIADTFEFGRAA